MPTGWPVEEKSVMAPVGLILGLLFSCCPACGGGVKVTTIRVRISFLVVVRLSMFTHL